jgi:5'-methylthioadenosine phosphorylase
MSVIPEAKLAREAEFAYAMICMSTDYDSWHSVNEVVSVEMVMGHMRANVENAKRAVTSLLDKLGDDDRELQDIVLGKQWEGSVKWAAGLTKEEGRKKETVEDLAWLFPEHFGGK